MSAATGAWAQDVSTNIVTKDNFSSFFDANGKLLESITFDELIFKDDFTNTDLVSFITIDRPITITSDNAVLNNIALSITGDNVTVTGFTLNENDADFTDGNDGAAIYVNGSGVTLDGVSVTYNAPNEVEAKAIFADGAYNFKLINSEITFTGANPGSEHYRGLEVLNSNAAKIDKNTITATFPAVAVVWGSYGSIAQDLVLAVGIQGGDNVEFTNNSVTVNTDGAVGSWPTIDAVMVYSANNILIKGNSITHLDTTTGEDARYYYSLDIYSTTGTVEANHIILNTSTDIDRNGGAYPINLTGPFTVTVKNNNITAISKGPTVGIYASNWNGAGDLTVENNIINVTGYATTDNYALVAGIEAEIDKLEASNNTITVENGADYDDAYQVYGVSMTSSYMSGDVSADIKDNNMTVDGKYAVYYAKANNTNVTGNALIAHDLIGNDAVYIEDGDGNTVQNNLPEDMASIVTQSNFFDFFDDSGILRNTVTFDKLFFKGEFANLVPFITLDRAITITGAAAVLNNIALRITGDDVTVTGFTLNENDADFTDTDTGNDGAAIYVSGSYVTLDNVSVTYNAPSEKEAKAIFANDAENFKLINSEIIFTGANPEDDHYRGLEVRNCDAAKIDKNTITATFPALDVDFSKGDGGSIEIDLVLGVGIQGGDNVEFTNNRVTVNTDGGIGGYPTIDAVKICSANNILIKGNNITHLDTTTGENPRYYYNLDIYSTTGTVEANNIILNTSTDIDRNGGAYPIYLTEPITVTVKDNNITAVSKGPIAGIYAMNYYGDADLIVENNNIDVTGYCTTTSIWDLVAGIEAEIDKLKAYNNTITVANGAVCDDTYPVYGVASANAGGNPSADIKDNAITVDGKYAVYYAKAVNRKRIMCS